MNNMIDTIQNLIVFVFIGAMIWLYFKKDPDDLNTEDSDEKSTEASHFSGDQPVNR